MLTLAIDTSCDETSTAVVCGLEIWSNVVASQVNLHRPYGGVFPTVAKQAHKENIRPTVDLALKRAGVSLADIDEIAVTIGPGLAPALEVGINYAQELSRQQHKPIRPVNHMEGHVLSVLTFPQRKQPYQTLKIRKKQAQKRTQTKLKQVNLPALAVLVSGGHTEFIVINPRHYAGSINRDKFILRFHQPNIIDEKSKLNHNSVSLDRKPRLAIEELNSGTFQYTKLGQTLDDAAGEALDKTGRMLGLGYPAGPVIEEFAKYGDANKYSMPLPMTTTKNYNLSFSGMKTHTRNLIENILKEKDQKSLTKQEIYDLSASVQYGVFRHILYKLNKVLLDYPEIKEVWLGGGVAGNMTLRKMMRKQLKETGNKNKFKADMAEFNSSATTPNQQLTTCNSKLVLRTPYSKRLCGDNAAMMGVKYSN